jgi:hypothetical protein
MTERPIKQPPKAWHEGYDAGRRRPALAAAHEPLFD